MNSTGHHYESNARSENKEPHYTGVDKQFQEVSALLDIAQKGFMNCGLAFKNSAAIARNYELAYLEEKGMRIDCAHAYAILYDQNQRAVNDVLVLTNNLEALQREFQKAQDKIKVLQSLQQETSATPKSDASHEHQVDLKEMELGIQNQQLQFHITELEHEIGEMKDHHDEALMNAASHICEMEEKYRALEQLHSAASPTALKLSPTPNDESIERDCSGSKPSRRKGKKNRQARKA